MMRGFVVVTIAFCIAVRPSLAKDTEHAELAKLLDAQFEAYLRETDTSSLYTDDVKLLVSDRSSGWDGFADGGDVAHSAAEGRSFKGHADRDLQIVVSRDGRSAWISLASTVHYKHGKYAGMDDFNTDYRISEIAVKTPAGWRIAGGLWSIPIDNASVNKSAKAGKQDAPSALEHGGGDASLRDAFTRLTTGPLDASAAARKELVAFGSGPGERTSGGSVLAKAWAAAWANHLTIDEPFVATLAPSGTTGWVIANINLDKKTYKIKFRVMFVFDKDASGAWSLVHAHFATNA